MIRQLGKGESLPLTIRGEGRLWISPIIFLYIGGWSWIAKYFESAHPQLLGDNFNLLETCFDSPGQQPGIRHQSGYKVVITFWPNFTINYLLPYQSGWCSKYAFSYKSFLHPDSFGPIGQPTSSDLSPQSPSLFCVKSYSPHPLAPPFGVWPHLLAPPLGPTLKLQCFNRPGTGGNA